MGYRVYVPERRDIVISRDVLFTSEKVCRDVALVENIELRKVEVVEPENDSTEGESQIEIVNDNREVSEKILDCGSRHGAKRQLRDRSKIEQT